MAQANYYLYSSCFPYSYLPAILSMLFPAIFAAFVKHAEGMHDEESSCSLMCCYIRDDTLAAKGIYHSASIHAMFDHKYA